MQKTGAALWHKLNSITSLYINPWDIVPRLSLKFSKVAKFDAVGTLMLVGEDHKGQFRIEPGKTLDSLGLIPLDTPGKPIASGKGYRELLADKERYPREAKHKEDDKNWLARHIL